MLKILDKNKNILKGIRVYKDLCIESVLSLDDKTLSFSAPYRNVHDLIQVEGYIETKEDVFVIKEIRKSSDGFIDVKAILDMESLEGKAFRSFKSTEQTIRSALQLAFAGTGWTIGICDITKKRTLSMTNVSALDVLKQALDTYLCEIKVNSKDKTVDIYDQIGEDKGVYFSSQLNLRSLDVESTSYDFYTEIEPYGKDGLTIESVNDGKVYLENHQYSDKSKRYIWKDERYTVPESLKEDASAKLSDMSKPYTSYSAEIIDLASASEKYEILEYNIGDTVTIMDGNTDTKEQQRIVSMKTYPDEPDRNECTLANKVLTFDELAQKYDSAANTVDNITNDNGQIDGDTIDGIYSRQVVDLENAIISSATIVDLTTKYLQVTGRLTAVEGQFGELSANVAIFEQTTTNKLTAIDASINTLITVDFASATARIDVLEATSSNIVTLLSGNACIGELQNIHLTTANAVIDSALIRTAVMESVTIGDLLAGTISTDKFLIKSDDGGIQISGATQQWRDANGVVRMQAGRDANGDFTFSLFDSSGQGVLIDSTGIKPGAIADGLIVNNMVADDASISASKLDINSLFNVINEDGSHTIKGTKVVLDETGQSLDIAFTQISSTVSQNTIDVTNLQAGMDGIRLNISSVTDSLTDLEKNTLLYNVDTKDNGDGTTTLTAHIYRDGVDVASEYPYTWFKWYRKSEAGNGYVSSGRTLTVHNSGVSYGGSAYIGEFATRDQYRLLTKSGKAILTKKGNYLVVEKEAA